MAVQQDAYIFLFICLIVVSLLLDDQRHIPMVRHLSEGCIRKDVVFGKAQISLHEIYASILEVDEEYRAQEKTQHRSFDVIFL